MQELKREKEKTVVTVVCQLTAKSLWTMSLPQSSSCKSPRICFVYCASMIATPMMFMT